MREVKKMRREGWGVVGEMDLLVVLVRGRHQHTKSTDRFSLPLHPATAVLFVIKTFALGSNQ